MKRVGILGAMPVEIELLKSSVVDMQEHKINSVVTLMTGKMGDKDVVFGSSNVGMVFASSVATVMIEKFNASTVVFTGVAGALDAGLKVGDIVIGATVMNYDMDCVNFNLPWDPSFRHKRGQIPFLNWREFPADEALLAAAMAAPAPADPVVVKTGGIVTGSEFLNVERKAGLAPVWKQMDDPLCVEMECAGVAQVCKAYEVPFLALRSISDTTTGDASEDFNKFCETAANNLFPVLSHVVSGLRFNYSGEDIAAWRQVD